MGNLKNNGPGETGSHLNSLNRSISYRAFPYLIYLIHSL